jgi:hypothetical protein
MIEGSGSGSVPYLILTDPDPGGPKTYGSATLPLKVPKCEIVDRSDFPNFYTIKSSWVGDLVVKILIYYFYF